MCGRGARKYVITPDLRVLEADPPYRPETIDLTAVVGGPSDQARADLIEAHTIGKLGAYIGLIEGAIRDKADGILALTAIPRCWKDYRLNHGGNLHLSCEPGAEGPECCWATRCPRRSQQEHPHATKGQSCRHHKSQESTVRLPLVIRGFSRNRGEFAKFISIFELKYEESIDPERPNSLCELLLQLLNAGPYRLPDHSMPVLVEMAKELQLQPSRGYKRLRAFVAGEMTWDEANAPASGDELDSFAANRDADVAASDHLEPNEADT